MTSYRLWLTAVILLAGVIAGVLRQDELFANFMLTLTALTFAIPYVIVVTLIAIVVRLMKLKIGNVLGFAVVAGYAFIGSIFLFVLVGREINCWKVASTESYVARAVPVLDKIKARDGAYPATLPVLVLGEPPELLRSDGDYSSNGTEFRFEYVDEPAGWAGGEGLLEFDSSNRKWINER